MPEMVSELNAFKYVFYTNQLQSFVSNYTPNNNSKISTCNIKRQRSSKVSWFVAVSTNTIPICGEMLRLKAEKFAKDFKVIDFRKIQIQSADNYSCRKLWNRLLWPFPFPILDNVGVGVGVKNF